MANEKVVFKRGTTTNLPTTKTPGTVLLDINTGAMYVDDTSSSRIQVKDTTKLGKTETASAAEKLSNTKAIGSATNPVYFNSSGVPVACTYTLGKSVPSSAVFTDTKVTAVGNHYTPSGGTTTSASGGTLTDITNSTSGIQVVTGVTKDAAGHVTGVTSVALKSVNTNTDTKVTQTNTTTSADYRIILSANSNDTTETSSTRKSANFLANPSTGEFYAKGYRRTDISGKTVDINTYNLSSGSPMRMFFIEKTNAGADNITNIPVASAPFLLDVELIRWVSATDYVTRQIYTNATNPANSYVRYCISGTWGDWTTRVYTDTTYSLSEAASGATYKITLTTSTGSEVKTATVPAGTTSAYGLVKLSSATNSTSTALAATPSAVKSAYDLANSANTLAGSKSAVSFSRSLTSGTKVGTITIDGTATDIYCQTNTDTHYTSHLITGASATATANAAATNGNVYLNILDNTTVRDSHNIVGSGATTVTSDANGKITISSTNTDTKVTSTTTNPTSSTSYYPTWVTGATTAGVLINNGFTYNTLEGTASATGYGIIKLGNSTASGTTGNKYGRIDLFSNSTSYGSIKQADTTSVVTHTLPATTGTILNTGTTSFTRSLSSGTKIGTIKINGTSTDIYCETNTDTTYTFASGTNGSLKITSGDSEESVPVYTHPTTAGNKHIPSGGASGQFLKYSAAGTAAWATLAKSDIPALDYVSSTTTRNANTVLAGPSSGNAAAPTFRALVTADLPASGATAGSYGPSANASPAHSGTFSVPYITVNAKGQVTAASTKTITLPASGNTDTKVTQNNSTADSSLRVLLSKSANDTNETNVSYKSNKITFNPSTGLLDIKGKVSISDSSYGCLELYRSGSNYFSGIKFYNDTSDSSGTKQLLGSIGMGNDPDTGLWRYNTDGSTKYKILDTENTSFTRTLTSGTKIGSIKINGTSTDIYCETNADTKNTAGSTNTSSKIFLIGATSQAANPQTYSHDTAYVGTDGCLYSNSTKVSVEGHTHSYLPLAGGTMTGPIKYNSGSKTSTPIVITDGDENGSMMVIGGTGGLTILGAGESANALAALIETEDGFPIPASDSGQFSYTAEHLLLSSDTSIYFFTNCNTVANRKAMVLTNGLNLYPDTTNTGNIGTSTYKWAGMYATTFHGALDGNASTATSAGKWTTGRTLTIGSTGKSVDGSGNVSWTLAEIGAAASSHTHTKSQITDFPASLKNPNSLTVKGNGTASFTYDGSAAKTLNIKPGTGISVSSDTSGNITVTNTSTNTDTKVTQSESTTANYRPILIGYTNSADSSALTTEVTNQAYVAEGIYVKPSTGEMFSNVFISKTDTRSTKLYSSGIKLVTDSSSNSAMGMQYYTADGETQIGAIGMYASANDSEISYAYIGKSYSDKWLNITADNTDFSGSIYVPQRIINKGKSCSTSAGSGAVGYYCIAQFKITGTYFDAPIEVEVSDRGDVSLTTFSIRFANENSTDPAVSSLRYRGNGSTAYICKSATSTWQLWVQASGTYAAITIHSIKCSHMNKMTISYPETYLSNDNFATAIASGGSLATNTAATVGTGYKVGSAAQWVTSRNINGMSINGSADIVNYGTCSTTNTTVEKVVACTGFALKTGSEITVKFTVTNKAKNPTLNVNSTGAKPIYYRGAAISASYLAANRLYTFRYNGTQYELVGDVNTNTDVNVTQTNLAVTTSNNQGLKLPLLLASKTVNSNNSYTDSNAYAVNCASKTSGATMTGLAWLETSYYSTSGTSGRSYAKICCEAFKCVGSGNFEGNATSASKLQTARKINGVDFTGQIDISLTKLLYSGSGSSVVTISADATNFDVLVIVVHIDANATDKTFIHATSSPIVQHPYCTYPTQGTKTTATLGNIATSINGTTVGVSVSNILISGSGSTVSCASETRTATINAVYGFNFS